MHGFKIKHFERDHPGERFPAVIALPSREVERLAERCALLAARVYASEPLPTINANSETFRLSEVWANARVSPAEELFLSFDGLRSIDAMRRDDVERHFTDVWYPVSDDLLVFDRSASWLVLIHHDGYVHTASR
jgi:hypothetical protein